MRYSITGATTQQVVSSGGKDIREARRSEIIFATLTEAQAAHLIALGCVVRKVEGVKASVMPPTPVAAIPTYSPEELVWAAGFEEYRSLTDPPLFGVGFNVAILDTGIRETHEKVTGRVIYRQNYTSDPMHDGFDHGTGVASIIVAVAPLCGIINMKVLNDIGEGTEESVVLAIEDCIDLKEEGSDRIPRVINLSLGADDVGDPSDPLRVACRAATNAGILVISAVGNGGPFPQSITSPACERYVGAVGSIKYEPFIISDFSSRGPTQEGLVKPDIVLFGEDLVVASSASDSASAPKSGTSFSAPFASGMAVLYYEGISRQAVASGTIPGLDPTITEIIPIRDLIDVYMARICIKPEGVATAKDYDYGYGMPFGPLISQAVGLVPVALDLSSIITAVLMIGMMGMVVKGMK